MFYSLMMLGSRNVLSLPSELELGEKAKFCPLSMWVLGSKKPPLLSGLDLDS